MVLSLAIYVIAFIGKPQWLRLYVQVSQMFCHGIWQSFDYHIVGAVSLPFVPGGMLNLQGACTEKGPL